MYAFELPDVGEGIAEAELLEWMVAVGDTVAEGDPVAIVNTDKVTVELPSPVEGTIAELPWSVGDVIRVGQVLIRFEVDGTTSAMTDAPQAEARSVSHSATPTRVGAAGTSSSLGRIVAAPSTRAVAARMGIDLSTVRGSGPGGRIVRADLAGLVGESPGIPAGAVASRDRSDVAAVAEPTDVRVLTGLRLLSARNIAKSRANTVTCTTTFEVHAEGLRDLLDALKMAGLRVTVPVVVAKCAAAALVAHPHLNGWIIDEGAAMELQQSVDVAFAVATDDGLAVPVVRDVANRVLRDVADDLADLSERARHNRLHPNEQRNGTFTISSTGNLETARILSTTPVINYPQVSTLWIGRMNPTARVGEDGGLKAGLSMVASFSFDHRFVDGADATSFINALAALLEQPIGAIA